MKKVALTILSLILCSATVVYSAEITPQSLDRLMALSGLNKQVAEFPTMVRAGAEQARNQGRVINDAEFDKIIKSIESAFQPEEMLGNLSSEIKSRLSEADAEYLLSWYTSDLGKKITKAEEDASTPEALNKIMTEAESLLADQKRVELAQKIDEVTGSTDMLMQIQNETALTVFTAVFKAENPDKPVPVEEFKAQMAPQKEWNRENTKQFLTVVTVYTYKDIDIDSLTKYIEFNEHPVMLKMHDGVKKGLKAAFGKAGEKMAASIVAMVKEQK